MDVLEIQMSQSRVTRSLVQFGQNGRIGQRVVQLVEVDNNFGHENVFFLTRELVDVLAIAKRHAIAMRTRVQFGQIGRIGQNVRQRVVEEPGSK